MSTAVSSDLTAPDQEVPVRIQASSGWTLLHLRDLWTYRELLGFLIWRDVKVRYKQTVLGAGWAIIQPLFTMVVFSLFFGRLAKVPSDGQPYAIFTYTALVPWTFFANGLSQSANSVVGSANLVRKVYFPRLVIPVAAILAEGLDFLIAFAVLLVMMPFFHVSPTINVVWLPALVVMLVMTSLGTGLWLSALNVQFRDIRYVVPFIVQFWMFATPVPYSSSMLEEKWRVLYAVNPMVGVVEGFRWALLGTHTAPGPMIAVSATVALLLLVSGLFYFRRMERRFADIV